jgi:hypothetical protein
MFKFILGVAIGTWFADIIKKGIVALYKLIKDKIQGY